MGFIDQHQIATLHLIRMAVDRLDSGKQDLRVNVAARQPGRIDASWRIGPGAQQRHEVLLDQLLHMGEDQHAGVAIGGDGLLREARDAEAFSRIVMNSEIGSQIEMIAIKREAIEKALRQRL